MERFTSAAHQRWIEFYARACGGGRRCAFTAPLAEAHARKAHYHDPDGTVIAFGGPPLG